MLIKAVSIVAPSSSRIASGEKTIEVRRWSPDLDIHEDLLIVENQQVLNESNQHDPDGHAVAVVKIANIRPFRPDDIDAACASYYEDGWFAWEISDVRALAEPFSAIAFRKIYQLDIDDKYLKEK